MNDPLIDQKTIHQMTTEAEELYISIGLQCKNAERSQMFGKPCFKINGKAFICFFQNEMVFKLDGDSLKEALDLKGSKLFDPSGKSRPMKEWVQIPFKHGRKWNYFTEKALEYVAGN
jgi:hypothetical protein